MLLDYIEDEARIRNLLNINTDHIIRHHLQIAYQFVLSSRHSPGINLR